MARDDRIATLDYWVGFGVFTGGGKSVSAPSSCSYGRHALVQPLSWKDHGGDAIGFWIRGLYRCTADHRILTANGGNWRQAVAIVAGIFRAVRISSSVCEGSVRKIWAKWWTAGRARAIGEGEGGKLHG